MKLLVLFALVAVAYSQDMMCYDSDQEAHWTCGAEGFSCFTFDTHRGCMGSKACTMVASDLDTFKCCSESKCNDPPKAGAATNTVSVLLLLPLLALLK